MNLKPLIFGLCSLVCAASVDGATLPVQSLEQLLESVQTIRSEEQRRYLEYAAEFERAAGRQPPMLEDAEGRRANLQESASELSERYSSNEVRITQLNRELNTKSTELGLAEVFGLARQVAADSAAILRQSLLSTQFPPPPGELPRDEALRAFAEGRTLPTLTDLERLWIELQREMTASGQVVRFPTTIIEPDGTEVEADVVRIGTFTATSDGRFLSYLPSLRTLNVLPRQLPADLMDLATAFEEITVGTGNAVVDPSRGVVLSLYVERPTLIERIELGETVGYVIIVVGLLGFAAFLYQLVHLVRVRKAVGSQLADLGSLQPDNPLGRVLIAAKAMADPVVAELRIAEAVLHEVPKLERFQAFLRLTVAAGPLLGLIGTVVGMIVTFQSITETGSSDPRLMAAGIGQAMIATVLGLGIAIPLLFANALLNALSRTLVFTLDAQSAGLLAERLENGSHA